MAKMEIDDVVDLSLSSSRDPALTITSSAIRDVRSLTQNSASSHPSTNLTNNNGNSKFRLKVNVNHLYFTYIIF